MPIRSSGKFKTLLFSLKILKFNMHIHDDDSEGTVSQIFYLGPSSHFINSRKKSFKKCHTV